MIKLNIRKAVTSLCVLALAGTAARAQVSNCNGFIRGNYIEVGVNGLGSYGSSTAAPEGYHPRGGSGVYNSCGSSSGPNLGFVADPDKDGWDVGSPNYVGDYFLPGSPYEGWEIQVNGSRYDQNNGASTSLGSVVSVNNSGSHRTVNWEGSYSGLAITQETGLDTGALFFTCRVTLRNTTEETLHGVYYLRGVDPDQEVPMGGSYFTNNTIAYSLPNASGASLVTATGGDFGAYLGLGTLDPRAKCYILPSWPPSTQLDEIHNGTAGGFTFEGSHNGDYAIGIVFNVGDLAPGASTSITFTYILRASDFITGLLSTIPNWNITGDTILAHDLESRDTAHVCQHAPTTVAISTPGSRTWSWTSLTGETLSASTGASVTFTTGTSLVRIIATALSEDSTHTDTVYMYVDPAVVMPSTPTAGGPSSVCTGGLINLTGSGGGSLATYHWSGPSGFSSLDQNPSLGASASSSGVYYLYAANYACYSPTVSTTVFVDRSAEISGPNEACIGGISYYESFEGGGSGEGGEGEGEGGPASVGGTWSSSNTTVGTINSSTGAFTGLSAGSTTISYVSTTGCSRSKVIVVNPNPIILSESGVFTMGIDGELGLYHDEGDYGYWSSSNPEIAYTGYPYGSSTSVYGYSAGTSTISFQSYSTGCVGTQTVNVAAPVYIEGSTTVCLGGNTTLVGSISGGTWSSSETAIATVSSLGVVSGLSAGTVTITYTTSTGYATHDIYVGAAPTITGGTAVCLGATMSLSSGSEGGSWSSSNTSTATVSSSGVVTGVAVGTSHISYTSSTGCVGSILATVHALPAAPSGAASVCVGSSVTLTNGVAGTWSSNNESVATVPVSPGAVTGIAAGTATISFRAGTTGCYSSRVISVNAAPAAIEGSSTVCIGNNVTYTSATEGGTWSKVSTPTAALAINSSTGVATGSAAGTATIVYTAGGCTTSKEVTISAQPNAITGTLTLCNGSTTTLSSTSSGLTWSSGNEEVATVGSASATTGLVTAVSAGTAAISYTNGAGCARVVVVTVSAGPSAIGGSSEVCIGGTITLTHGTTGGTWTSSTPAKATINSVSGLVTGVAAGTTTISYAVTASCVATKTINVTTGPAAIGGSSQVCVGANITLTHAIEGGTWTSSTPAKATINATTGVVTGVAAGTTKITYATGSGGCSVTTIITVVAAPAAIGGTAVVCEGATVTLTNSTPGGSWVNDGANASVGSTGIVTGINAGTSVISYVLTGAGCYVTKVATINTAPTAIMGTNPLCVGVTTTLTSTPSGGTWGTTSSSVAPVNMTTGSLTGGGSGGTATVSYTLSNGCKRSIVVTVNALPGALTGGTTPFCTGNTTNITAATASLTWSSANTSVATVTATSAIQGQVTGIAAGTATISYANAAGCARTQVVTVTAAPGAIMGIDEICVGGTTTMTNGTSGGTWASSTTAKATIHVTSGVLTGVALGTTTITYRVSPTCYTTMSVAVVTSPSAGIVGPSGVCIGADVTFTHPSTGGTWSSSNTSRATVNSTTGQVTGVSTGSAVITYYNAPGCFTTKSIYVYPYVFPVSGTFSVCVGSTATLNSAQAGGTWSISNANGTIAPGSGTNGILTGITEGTSIVTYTYPTTGCYRFAEVTVNPVPTPITGSGTVCVNANTTLASTPAGGTWTSGAGIYATVNSSTGEVTGVAANTVNITYTRTNGCVAVKNMTVNPIPGNITGTAVVNELSSTTLGTVSTGGTWSMANTSIATIGASTGVATGVATGTTTVSYTFTSTGCARTRVFTVNPFGSRAASSGSEGPLGSALTSVSVYPSPTTGIITVEAPVTGVFTVMTMDGRELARYEMNATVNTVTLPRELAAGTYLCRFKGADGSVTNTKIVLVP